MEAKSAFGDGSVYIERYISPVRHVEIQVFGDGEDVIHLGERECSIQRRHQKLLEESPSPVLSDETRQRMGGRPARWRARSNIAARARWSSSWTARAANSSSSK